MGLVSQVFTMFVLTVAAAEAAIGLAILVCFFRNRGTIDVEDDTLSITGDDAANTIAITHNGAGNVSVVCDGAPAFTASGIKEIVVDAGGGKRFADA